MTESSHPAVCVLRANDICFSGILRGVTSAGFSPIPIIYGWEGASDWFGEQSQHFKNAIEVANPFEAEDLVVEQLVQHGKRLLEKTGKRSLALPSSDTNLMVFQNNEAQLCPYYALMGDADFGDYRTDIACKARFYEQLSRALPENTPQTRSVARREDIEPATMAMEFPVIIKPAVKDYGQTFYQQRNGSKAVVANSAEQLRQLLEEMLDQGHHLVVQEKIEFGGPQDEIPFYAYFDQAQRLRIGATGSKDVINPAPFGTANVLQLTWRPELLELAKRVGQAIQWRGTLMIEFIRDQKDGRWKVIEVNVRPWLFNDFYRLYGLPFVPYAVLDYAGLLSDEETVITPSQEWLETARPIHVDPIPILKEKRVDFETFWEYLMSFGNQVTLAQGGKDDPEVMRATLAHVAKQFGWSTADAVAFAERLDHPVSHEAPMTEVIS